MKKNILLFVLSVLSFHAISQTEKDSLENSFRNEKYNDTLRIKAGQTLAKKFYLPNKPDSALILLDRVISLGEKNGLNKWLISPYGTKGIANLYKGDLSNAKINFEQCISLAKQFKDTSAMHKGMGNLASVHYKLGNYQLALNYYQKILDYQKKNKLDSEVTKTLVNMSNIYSELSLFSLAKENLLLVKKMREDLNDFKNLPSVYINLGNIYSDLNIIDSSFYYTNVAAELALKNGQTKDLALAYCNLGELNARSKNYDKSNYYFNKCLKLREEIGDQLGIVSVKYALACNDSERGQFKEARVQMEKNFLEVKEIGDVKLLISISRNLYESYKNEGDYKKALYYYEISNENNDKLNKEELNKTVKQQKIQYEFQLKEEKLIKEQEIRNLQAAKKIDEKISQRNLALLFGFLVIAIASIYIFQRNKLRKQKEKTIKYMLSEYEMKALRAQINTHFIYNALNGINRFIYEKMPDKAASYLSKFANLLRITVEHTRNSWVEMDQELIAIQLYVELEALNQKDPINFSIEIAPQIDTTKTLIPPMLIQPLVENALKHSGGLNIKDFKLEIIVNLFETNLSISIIDNGPSLGQREIVSGKEGLSLATKIIKERLSILDQQEKTISSIEVLQEKTKFGLSTVSKLVIPYKFD
jgi:tetratricopeptide (TPR) repeat protein